MTEAERQAAAVARWAANHPDATEVEYGLQWGRIDNPHDPHFPAIRQHLAACLADIPASGSVCEIGTGGGRWTREFEAFPGTFHGFDGTPAAFDFLRRAIRRPLNLHVSLDGTMPDIASESLDLVFSFDTFVHFDSRLFGTYCGSILRVLKPGGRLILHVADEWPGLPPHDGTCFIIPPRPLLDGFLAHFRMDATCLFLPVKAGFGSTVWGVIKK